MAHVAYLEKDQAAADVQTTFEGMEKKLGKVPNIYRAMGLSPELMKGFLEFNGAFGKSKLDAKLRELAYMTASRINACEYCLHYHKAFGRKAGLGDEQIEGLATYASNAAYDDLQKDVMAYAEQVTRQIRPDARLVQRLRTRLSDREMVEVALVVSMANLTNRFNEALGIDLP